MKDLYDISTSKYSVFILNIITLVCLISFFYRGTYSDTNFELFYFSLHTNIIWKFMAIILCVVNLLTRLSFELGLKRFFWKHGTYDGLNGSIASENLATPLGKVDRFCSTLVLIAIITNNLLGINPFYGFNFTFQWFIIISIPAMLIILYTLYHSAKTILWARVE